MNRKTELEDLSRELQGRETGVPDNGASTDARHKNAPVSQQDPRANGHERPGKDSLLIARLVKNLSKKDWQIFCATYPHSQWYAFEIQPEVEKALRIADLPAGDNTPWFRLESEASRLFMALQSEMFVTQLKKELLRLSRTGGSMCLISAAIADRHSLGLKLGEDHACLLDDSLGQCMSGQLDACDSLGVISPGRYMALLPGVGQLKARRLAYQLQRTFSEYVMSVLSSLGMASAVSPMCAVGILNIVHDSRLRASKLFSQATEALEKALTMGTPYINQVFSNEVWDEATLVHSNEKRFLFFGGETA